LIKIKCPFPFPEAVETLHSLFFAGGRRGRHVLLNSVF
jgi:hypothetical protein